MALQGHRDCLAEMPSITTAGPHAADAPPDHTQTAPRNQPGTTGPVHVALRTLSKGTHSSCRDPQIHEQPERYEDGYEIEHVDGSLQGGPEAPVLSDFRQLAESATSG